MSTLRFQPARPRQEEEVAVIGVVVGMLVSHEDVAECGQRHPGAGELDGDAVAAVNDVGHAVDDDRLRRRETVLTRPRAATRAEQDEPCLGMGRRLRGRPPRLRDRER